MSRAEVLFLDKEEEEVLLAQAPQLAHVINLGIDWERRVIHVAGEITPESGEWFWTVLERLGHEQPIQVHLNTPGGDVSSMYAMHDAIRRHGMITIVGYGEICSAGVLLLACGHHRQVTENCILMSHESRGSGGDDLGYRAAKDRRKVEDWLHERWCELMARYTPNDAKWWKTKTERQAEYWLLGGKEIVEAGLADEVI